MVVHIKKALRLYLDYNVITCTHVLHLLFTIKPQKIVSLNTTTTILTISSETNRPFIRKEPATHISSERIRFGYLPWRRRCFNIMVIYMYIAPGQGQTTPWSQNIFLNINLLSICSFLASFLPFNYIFLFFPIQKHGRPKLTLP